jgi:signal transduction histidine kinase
VRSRRPSAPRKTKPSARSQPRRPKRARARKSAALTTVRVPDPIRPLFLKAQKYVARYFGDKALEPETGTISISGERYILLRAASMSVEFFDLVTSLYQDKEPAEARGVATNLLFDVAHAIGKADARAFHKRMGVTDPIEKLSAGPIHFSFSGWAFVDILPDSRPAADDSYFLVYDHPFSFESDAWLKRGRRSDAPVCVMNAGYSSGWCEESFGLPLVAVEIECLAAGGAHCRFIMAPPSRIEEHLARYARRRPKAPPRSIPEFFQRKRMEEQLRHSHESLERRVEERTAALRSANAARDEFLSVAAHELKTPMTSLRGFTQVLLRQIERGESPDPARLRQALVAIDQQSEKLARLVAQLLDISRIEAGQLVLERKVADVMGIVEAVAAMARARTARHEFAVAGPIAALALVDPLRLEQVLTNLVENAIKYTPQGGEVAINVARERDTLRISVTDRGLGIPPEHRERIFDRFYQAHSERLPGGMGLGLYISKQIVDLHGGRLEVAALDVPGTRMVVSLPTGHQEP